MRRAASMTNVPFGTVTGVPSMVRRTVSLVESDIRNLFNDSFPIDSFQWPHDKQNEEIHLVHLRVIHFNDPMNQL